MSQGDAPALAPEDLAVDLELTQLAAGLEFILQVTPIETAAARDGFLEDRSVAPEFAYRDLATDPAVLEARLDEIRVDRIEDATLRELLAAKHRELSLQIRMLGCRGSQEFRALALELYGGVDAELLAAARQLLEAVPRPPSAGATVDAPAFLALARAEIERYKEQQPDVEMRAEIREGVSGVLVSGDTLLISPVARVQEVRVTALLQHEIGTHLVTQVNGAAQPVKCFGAGFAGYDQTQEGLAVLAEIACGQLTPTRLRQLAARVVTVHAMLDGASFGDCYDALTRAGFGVDAAFTTTMRVFRSGGLPKDACYLRGVLELLGEVREGRSLDLLFRGKFALEDAPRVAELESRGILAPVLLVPRWLADPAAAARLERAARAESLAELLAPDGPAASSGGRMASADAAVGGSDAGSELR